MIFMLLVGIMLVFILFFYSIMKVQSLNDDSSEKDYDDF